MKILTVFTFLTVNWVTNALPWNLDDFNSQTPAQDRSWGSKLWGKKKQQEEGPSYAINPNFGFRSYHQIRYEPMTVPFEYSEPPAQIPPVDFGYPVDSYEGGNDYNYGGNDYIASPSEFSARQAPYSSYF